LSTRWAGPLTYTCDSLNRTTATLILLGLGLNPIIGTDSANFAYNGSIVWAQLSGSSTIQILFAEPVSNDLVARVDSTNGVLWYVTDASGSVLDLVNNSGVPVERIKNTGYQAQSYSQSGNNVTDLYGNNILTDYPLAAARIRAAVGSIVSQTILLPAGAIYGWLPGVVAGVVTWVESYYSATAVNDLMRSGTSWIDPATGMQWNGRAFYDPGAGRYVNEDPQGLAAANYTYQTNNPSNITITVGKTDPFTRVMNFFAGAADVLSLGLTRVSREVTGIDTVDTNSTAYMQGMGAGGSLLVSIATLGLGSVLGAGAWGTAALGAGLNTGMYLGQAAATGQQITAGGLLGAFVGGAAGGLASAGAIGALGKVGIGGTSWAGTILSGAVAGFVGATSTSLIEQCVDHGSINWGAVGQAGLYGFIGVAGAAPFSPSRCSFRS